jgi:hypothetical protein
MKRQTPRVTTPLVTLFGLLFAVALAAPVTISGSIKTNLSNLSALRVGAFLTDRNGNPGRELSSSGVSNTSFNLSIPEAAPSAGALSPVVSDNLDWPGLVGKVTVSGQAKAVRVILRAYLDADRSGNGSAGDGNLETAVTHGRGSLVLVYSDARFRVQGDKGFDVTVEPGWNLIAIELGRSIETKRVTTIDAVQLEVFSG